MGVSDAVGGFSSLPYVQTELNAIVRQTTDDDLGIYPGTTFLNDTFDYRSLRDNLTGHQILHLATHGVFVPGSADDSFLLLGDGEQLRIPDIQTLTQLQDIHRFSRETPHEREAMRGGIEVKPCRSTR
jgi:CHAT domain-containing protein